MTYLVLYADGALSRLKVHHEDDNVPAGCICWHLKDPSKADKAVMRLKQFWVSGSVYDKGALLVIDQLEAVGHLRMALGPSLEEQIEVKEASHENDIAPWVILACIILGTAGWFIAKSLIVVGIVAIVGSLLIGVIAK